MERGYFDEAGHFVERGFNQSDAWLDEMDEVNAQVVGGAKRRFVKPLQTGDEEQEQELLQQEKKPSMGQLAAWADELRAMLADEKETVASLLKRLAQAKRDKRGGAKAQHAKADPLFARPVARQKEGCECRKRRRSRLFNRRQKAALDDEKDAFDKASTLADQLLGSGQQSVFSFRKKVLKKLFGLFVV